MGQTSGYTLNIGYKTRAVKKLVARFFADPCATLIVVSSGLTLRRLVVSRGKKDVRQLCVLAGQFNVWRWWRGEAHKPPCFANRNN
jgi:hypothetical protein